MGNYVSCAFATPLMKNSRAARVIFPSGEVRQFREPTKAAELMLERPNFFLANSQSLHIGRRFSALGADEELEFGNVYLMFPMKRVNSIVTAGDMAVYFMAANSAAKRISGKVLPDELPRGTCCQSNDDEGEDRTRLSVVGADEEVDDGFQAVAEFKYRLSVCRSRKPMLETIKEEPVIG